jgi:hypothetical protein
MPSIARKTNMQILQEIQTAFPNSPMPPLEEMIEFAGEDTMGGDFIKYLDTYRFKDLDEEIIRSSRMELYYLSPDALKWILSHILGYCLTAEIRLTPDVVESLAYFFNPGIDQHEDRLQRASALSKSQLESVKSFFDWHVHTKYLYGSNPDWNIDNLDEWYEQYFEEMRQAAAFCELAIKSRGKV